MEGGSFGSCWRDGGCRCLTCMLGEGGGQRGGQRDGAVHCDISLQAVCRRAGSKLHRA